MMEELHSQGKTIEDIVNCLNRVPLHPQIVSAIQSAHAQGYLLILNINILDDEGLYADSNDLKVLSDANQFFIETILKNHGVYDCFSEIITNPIAVDKEGRLRIFPYHGSEMPPHGCDLCPPSLCKVIIYIGDGGGDFCPTLKLGKEDHVMPRNDFPLHNLILKSFVPVKPEVHEWSDGDELNKILLRLIDPLEA
ncbi:thiamine phosphate phosphatase-like protein [Tanacetum coccineum]